MSRLPGRAGWLKTYGTPEEILVPNNYTVAVFNGTTGKEEGRNVLYATSKGKPGHLNVIDLEDYKLSRSIPIGPSESSWAHTTAPDGTLFLAADGGGQGCGVTHRLLTSLCKWHSSTASRFRTALPRMNRAACMSEPIPAAKCISMTRLPSKPKIMAASSGRLTRNMYAPLLIRAAIYMQVPRISRSYA